VTCGNCNAWPFRCAACGVAPREERTSTAIRGYARRGQLFATMSKETVDALEELADRIEQGEPVS
jgi:hypothetical protein